jgi:hypothetical protein
MGMFQLTRLGEGIANEVPDNPVVGIFCAALPRTGRGENCESPSVPWAGGVMGNLILAEATFAGWSGSLDMSERQTVSER